jgi:hypothetical protein
VYGENIIMFKKILKKMPFILIIIAVIIALINYIYPIISDFYVVIIMYSSFFILFIVELFQDIKDRIYSTSILILIVDILKMIALIVLCYFAFQSYEKASIDLLINRTIYVKISGAFMVGMISIKSLLESKQRNRKDIS